MAQRTNIGSGMMGTVEKASRGYMVDTTGPNDYSAPTMVRLSDNEAINFWLFNGWVNAVVNRIVADIVKVPPVVRVRNQQVPSARQERRMKKVQDFLDNPNDNDESFSDIREKTVRDLMIVGRGVMEKVFDDDDNLVEIYACVSKNIKIKSDVFGNIPMHRAYKMERTSSSNQLGRTQATPNSEPIYWDRNEIIFMVKEPVSWSLYGHKPMDTLAQTVATDIVRDLYNSVFFTNNGEASGMYSLEGLSKNELKRFKSYMQNQHKGASNAHRTMAVNVPVKYIQTAISNRDMQFQEYGVELRQKIFSVFGMQPIIMGVLDGSTGRLNSEQQVQAYKDGAVKPVLRKEAYAYTQEICWDGFGFQDLEIVFPEVDLLDAKTQSEIDRLDASGAIITINEIRARRKLSPVKWGDAPVMLLPGGGQINPETGEIEMPATTGEGEKKPDKKPKEEKKPKPEPKKNLISYYSYDLKNWVLTNLHDIDYEFMKSQYGEEFIVNNCDDLKESSSMIKTYRSIVHMLESEEQRTVQELCEGIDGVIQENENHSEA